MEVNKQNERRVVAGRSLIDIVFSWSFKDVLNQEMYKKQVLNTKTVTFGVSYCKYYI